MRPDRRIPSPVARKQSKANGWHIKATAAILWEMLSNSKRTQKRKCDARPRAAELKTAVGSQ